VTDSALADAPPVNPLSLEFLEKIEAEIKRRQVSRFSHFVKWRRDPVGFVEEGLLGYLWSKQKEIMLSVRDNRRTAVKSCHDVGKSYVAARIGAWWISCNEPGDAFLVTLAPTFHQVKGILWRELQKAHAAGGLPGTMNLTEWKVGPELVGFGRSPADNDPTAIQGIHAARVLVIGDEACGLAKAVLEGADSLVANDDSRILLIGNPDDPSTEFATVCKPGSGWNVIRINALESPNFTDEPIPDRIRPLLVSRTWVGEKRKSWGEESPLYTSKVLGDFPEQASDALIPTASVTAATDRWKEGVAENAPAFFDEYDPGNLGHDLGVDCAREGDDASVIYRRKGFRARVEHRHHKKDLMQLVGEIVRACRREKPKRIKIDDTGMGGGVTDRLREIQNSQRTEDNDARTALAGVEICPINVGAGSLNSTADERFVNLRAELNWNMRVIFTEKPLALEPSDDLESQIVQIKYKVPNGEISIEKKADMKKRTKGKSPDDWDALVLAYAEPQIEGGGLLKYYQEQAAKLAQPTTPPAVPTAANGGVVLTSPVDGAGSPMFSTVYGMSGKMYSVVGGQITVIPDDVPPLLAQGFVRAEA
jgi:hypothetical protein